VNRLNYQDNGLFSGPQYHTNDTKTKNI